MRTMSLGRSPALEAGESGLTRRIRQALLGPCVNSQWHLSCAPKRLRLHRRLPRSSAGRAAQMKRLVFWQQLQPAVVAARTRLTETRQEPADDRCGQRIVRSSGATFRSSAPLSPTEANFVRPCQGTTTRSIVAHDGLVIFWASVEGCQSDLGTANSLNPSRTKTYIG